MVEWKVYKLNEVIEKFIDYRGRTPQKTATGIPLITAKIVKNGRILEPTEFIAADKYHEWMTRGYPEINDVVLTTEAPLGEVALLKDKNVALAQRIITLRGKKDVCDNAFLKYYFQSNVGQGSLQSRAQGSTVEGIKSAELQLLEIRLPDLLEQQAIASVLSSLDQKIDLLQRQNSTLEALAETLFGQWFIEEAEAGWQIGMLGDVISIHDSERIPVSRMEREKMKAGPLYPYYGAASIMDYINQYIFDGEYILMGEDGTVQTDNGYPVLQLPRGKFWVNNHAHIFQAKSPFSNFFIYNFLKRTSISHIVTGAVQPKINQENLKSIEFRIPPLQKVMDFVWLTDEWWNKIKGNTDQARTLTHLRDTLLPKLISGAIRVAIGNGQA